MSYLNGIWAMGSRLLMPGVKDCMPERKTSSISKEFERDDALKSVVHSLGKLPSELLIEIANVVRMSLVLYRLLLSPLFTTASTKIRPE